MLDRFQNNQKAEQLENFIAQFNGCELCLLLTDLSKDLGCKTAKHWGHRNHAPGITSIWQMMDRNKPKLDYLVNTLNKLTLELVPYHLPLICDIHHFFATPSRSSFYFQKKLYQDFQMITEK